MEEDAQDILDTTEEEVVEDQPEEPEEVKEAPKLGHGIKPVQLKAPDW